MTLRRTEFKRKARKPKKRKSATGPLVEPEYFKRVKARDCCVCGRSGPSDGHHCRDRPPDLEIGVYRYFPGAGETSADADAIPLCRNCHCLYHLDRSEFHRRAGGPDYQFIPTTRAMLSCSEIDY